MSKFIFLLFAFVCVQGTDQDHDCTVDGVKGKCVNLRVCPSALKDIRLKINPQICSFNGTSSIPDVCCVSPMVDKPSAMRVTSDQKECSPITEHLQLLGSLNQDKQIKQGHKAWAKCLEYQERAVFPCQLDYVNLNGETRNYRADNCYAHYAPPPSKLFGGGGIDAEEGEFPHMALLGYGNDTESAQWYCGGSLISERYILTAAHCISSIQLGPVAFAALGALSRTESKEEWDIYMIKTIIKHPGYKAPSKYNDIALLETEKEVKFRLKVTPACLHVGDEVPDSRASATGWGAFSRNLDLADVLQDVPLWKVPDANCSFRYPPHRHLLNGYNSTIQVCYGDDGLVRDTCQGDSGGPLNLKSEDIYCMYLIVGVTSFGYANCGQVGYPGVYSRVSHYVPWIESVVWP